MDTALADGALIIRSPDGHPNSPGVAADPPAQIPPPWPPTLPAPTVPSISKCEVHRAFIDAQLRLGRNAMAIYQDLVDLYGFDGAYNSVKRFAAQLRHVVGEPVVRRVEDGRIHSEANYTVFRTK